MLSLSHTLISLPFGVWLDTPIFIFTAAFLFHFICDSLLHWNVYPWRLKKYFYPAAMVDVISGLIIAAIVLGDRFYTPAIWLAVAGGNMPDILQESWQALPKKIKRMLRWAQPFFDFHENLQKESLSPARGLVWQIILVMFAISIVQ